MNRAAIWWLDVASRHAWRLTGLCQEELILVNSAAIWLLDVASRHTWRLTGL